MSIPPNVVFGSVNFECESLEEGLRRHGVQFDVPTMFSWLGVTMYLTEEAVDAVLRTVARFPAGSEIVFTFANRATQPIQYNGGTGNGTAGAALGGETPGEESPGSTVGAIPRAGTLAALAARAGEPWISYFEPDELDRKLRDFGFAKHEFLTPEQAQATYFSGREDALPAPTRTSIVSATV